MPPAVPGPSPRLLARHRAALHGLYLLSGASGLLYEVAWTRLLTLDLGHTVASASAVLAAFMGGMAGGALAAGRSSREYSPRRALAAYAVLELAVALAALVLPWGLAATRPVLAAAYGDAGGPGFGLVRVINAVVLVGLPAAAMGATYPLMVRASADRVPRAAAWLYAVNTFGAAAGALAAGYLLLPRLGTRATTMVGIAVNVLIAACAWRLSLRWPAGRPAIPVPARSGRSPGPSRPLPWATACAAVVVSGACALALEVAWTRVLALVLGPTTYAFSAMLASFILGLAAGSLAAARIAPRAAAPAAWMAGCLTLSAAAAAVAVGQVDAASLRMARMAGDPGTTFAAVMVHQWVTALALLGPVAFGFGAIFPFALRAAREESAAGPAFLYGVNSAGAVAGALGAGFFLVPRVGLLGTVRVAVGACAAAAIAIALRGMPSVGGRLAVAAMSAAAVVATATSQWDYRLLSSGAYKYAAQAAGGDVEVLFAAGRLRLYREGAAATVAVRDVAGVRSLSIDGKVDASNGGDMLTQRLLAHVPLLLHPAPRAVGIVGLGSGVTLGSALAHAPKRVDVFEISPEVVEAARLFEAEHGGALDHPAVRIVVGDARTHFALTRAGYDVIISEPSNPWMAGIAALFTQEFFLKLRDSLAAGGIVCQWAHTYDMSAANLRSIVATFHSVFPRMIVWSVGEGDLLLVGLTEDATGPGFSRMASGFDRPGVPVDLASVGVTGPAVLASLVLAGPDDVARFAAGAEIQRDDRMALEFSAPSAMAGRPREDAPGALRAAFPDRARPAEARAMAAAGGPRARRDTALMLMRADAMESAWPVLVPALEGLPGDRDALAALTRIGAATGRLAEVERLLVDLARRAPGEIAARLELSRWLAAAGRGAEALAVARDAEAIAPSSAAAAAQVAAVAADLQDLAILRPAAARLRALAPDSADTAYYSGIALLIDSRATEAAAEAARAAARQPGHARAWNLLGAALGAAGGPVERIREAFERAIVADPRDPAAYVNLAALDLRAGRPAEAAARFAEALMIDPSNAAARDGFRTARARLD